MIVRLADSRDHKRIDGHVESDASCSLYHLTAWGEVVRRSFGHPFRYLVCEDGEGRLRGLLPLVHMKSRLFGNRMVSMPYFNYGGVRADCEAARDLLVGEAVRVARSLEAGHIEFRQESPLGNGFPAKTAKVSMRLPLPESADELFASFPSKLKSQIRRPEKEGMAFRTGGAEMLDAFYRVFSIGMRDHGTPVYPVSFFRNILEIFPERTRIGVVSSGGTAVAAGFLVVHRGTAEIPWACSVRSYNRFSPNMLLYWGCLRFACERGLRVFDFGRSTAGEGTFRFKEQWGARPVPLYWHYWMAGGGPLPDLSPGNPKYALAIAAWKRLPVPITRILGPLIVRDIP